MEQRTLEFELISAKDIKDVNLISKMDVYAVISLQCDGAAVHGKHNKVKTKVAKDCGTSPTWNFPTKFMLDEFLTQQNRLTLEIKLVCERNLGDKDIGKVVVPVKELFDSAAADAASMKFVSYQVRRQSGKPKGELSFSYKFGEKVVKAAAAVAPPPSAPLKGYEPVTAYPVGGPSAPPVAGYGGYPPMEGSSVGPPPAGYGYPGPPQGYGYPPPPGYGYPPPPPGYVYPPGQQPQEQPKKKNKFGMGLGAGLFGGMLGGLLIGDMVSGGGCGGGGCGGGCGGG